MLHCEPEVGWSFFPWQASCVWLSCKAERASRPNSSEVKILGRGMALSWIPPSLATLNALKRMLKRSGVSMLSHFSDFIDACYHWGVYFGEYQGWGRCCRERWDSLDREHESGPNWVSHLKFVPRRLLSNTWRTIKSLFLSFDSSCLGGWTRERIYPCRNWVAPEGNSLGDGKSFQPAIVAARLDLITCDIAPSAKIPQQAWCSIPSSASTGPALTLVASAWCVLWGLPCKPWLLTSPARVAEA